jgi:predicted acyltransferase
LDGLHFDFYWLIFVISSARYWRSGSLFHEGNISRYIDRCCFGRFCCYELGDNEGILPTISAVATGLLGMLTGEFLMSSVKPMKKVMYMTIAAILLMIVGQVWNLAFPINKNLWSSSFVCWVGGLSMLLLAIFY